MKDMAFSFDRVRPRLAAVAALLWLLGATLVLINGGMPDQTPPSAQAPEPSTWALTGSLVFLLAIPILLCGHRHKPVLYVMGFWFVSALLSLADYRELGLDMVYMIRVVGLLVAAPLSFFATRRDERIQRNAGITAPERISFIRRYPQFIPMLVFFLSGIPFVIYGIGHVNLLLIAAALITLAGDASFGFSKQILAPQKKTSPSNRPTSPILFL